MSISTQRSLAQLKSECQFLGLNVVKTGARESKTDYINALRQYHIQHTYNNKLPKSLELMLQIDSPMLCKRYPELKDHEQEAIWSSPNWYIEEKIDGNRQVVLFLDDPTPTFDSFSRNISVTDYLPASYGEKIYLNLDWSKIKNRFILDSEVISTNPNISTKLSESRGVVTETQLQATSAILALNKEESLEVQKEDPLKFYIFDCLWWDGQWLTHLPLYKRLAYVQEAVKQLQSAGFLCERPKSAYKADRRQFYEDIIDNMGEGVVAKDLTSVYTTSNSRGRSWIKVKRTMTEAMAKAGLGDSLDGWVSGYTPGDPNKGQAHLIGSIDISVSVRKPDGEEYDHVIARVSNLPIDMKEQMTEIVDGVPQLKKEYYGRVCSVQGQAISARVRALKHATFLYWRPDRSMDTCIIDEEFLNSQII